jgi:putative PIN family toxin of toxin-antitoxin system
VKVVLDTNVILAAFATRGLCEAVMAVCVDRHEIVVSEAILAEVSEHLRDKFKLPASRVREIVSFLRHQATMVIPVPISTDACRDPDDLAILGTAVAAQADGLITGDNDLLSLGTFQEIRILSPRAFYELNK